MYNAIVVQAYIAILLEISGTVFTSWLARVLSIPVGRTKNHNIVWSI